MRQIQKTPDMDAISLDNIDTTAAWRVETERPVMESTPDWLDVDPEALVPEEEADAQQEEPVVEEEEQSQEAEQEEDVEEEVTPSRMGSSSGSVSGRAQRPPIFFASRGRLGPSVFRGAEPSSSRGKGKAIPYSRKRGRGSSS